MPKETDLRDLVQTLDPKTRDYLRRILIRDHAARDAIASRLMRYRDQNGQGWADVIDFLTMHPEGGVEYVREWWTEDRWTKVRDAHARAAVSGRRWRGPTGELYTGPLRRGWWLQPHTAEELSELLALAVLKAEGLTYSHSPDRT